MINAIIKKLNIQCWFIVEFICLKQKLKKKLSAEKMSAATYTSDIDICQRVIPSETYYEPNGTYYTQIYSNSLLEQPEGKF